VSLGIPKLFEKAPGGNPKGLPSVVDGAKYGAFDWSIDDVEDCGVPLLVTDSVVVGSSGVARVRMVVLVVGSMVDVRPSVVLVVEAVASLVVVVVVASLVVVVVVGSVVVVAVVVVVVAVVVVVVAVVVVVVAVKVVVVVVESSSTVMLAHAQSSPVITV
jgi:hypothetical protein